MIARNSSFTYKGKAVSVPDVGRELGVRYVLEGSVRRAGSRVRVTAQLIDALSGGHLWAERFDRELADLFSVQDEITGRVSGAILPAVERSERERAARKPPHNLDAWENYHRGMWHFANVEAAENEKARSFFERAIELDPRFAPAEAALALTYLNEITLFRPQLRTVNIPRALDHAGTAIKIDGTDATAHAVFARALWMSGRHPESLAEADLAVSLDPNSASAHGAKGGACLWGGRPREAIEPLQIAMRLSPFDPLIPLWLHFIARAYYWAEDYPASVAAARQLRYSFPNFRQPYNTLIAALGQTGQTQEAQATLEAALERFGAGFRHYMTLPLAELRDFRSGRPRAFDRGLPQSGGRSVRIGGRRPPFPDPDLIRTLAALLTETGLTEIEYAVGNRRIRVARAPGGGSWPGLLAAALPRQPARARSSIPARSRRRWSARPISAPQPGDPPFVRLGDSVAEGQPLLIIEAMKVMNQIRAHRPGRVAQILVADAQPVEYGAVLMLIE